MHYSHAGLTVLGLFAFFTVATVVVIVGWILPICLGVSAAKRKNISALWMLFGIHPIFGWIACIILLCITPRVQCPNCGGFTWAHFRICPYCHATIHSQ
jgi:hypothetical protein